MGHCAGDAAFPERLLDERSVRGLVAEREHRPGKRGTGQLVQPHDALGTLDGKPFKHPIITWGNGITTTPSYYTAWFNLMASNGFVVIASNSSSVTVQNMTD